MVRPRMLSGNDAAVSIPPTGRNVLAGMFELFVDSNSSFRFRLKAPDGTVMAVSRAFEDKSAAVAGIAAVREYAGMGLITDLSTTAAVVPAAASGLSAVQRDKFGRMPEADLHMSAKQRTRVGFGAPRRAPWTRIT